MRRAVLMLMVGIVTGGILVSAFATYAFHNVDPQDVGLLNLAFAGLIVESVMGALVIGLPVWFLTWLGRLMFRLHDHAVGWQTGLWMGVGLMVLQYPCEIATNLLAPSRVDLFRGAYLIAAVVVCTAVFLLRSLPRSASPAIAGGGR